VSALTIILVPPVVLGLFAAAVNYGVWAQRRDERSHLALAFASAAGLALLAAAGLMYSSDSRAGGIAAHTALFLCSIPVQLGNVFLVERVYKRPMRIHYLTALGFLSSGPAPA
jgi:hypothetical protein